MQSMIFDSSVRQKILSRDIGFKNLFLVRGETEDQFCYKFVNSDMIVPQFSLATSGFFNSTANLMFFSYYNCFLVSNWYSVLWHDDLFEMRFQNLYLE